MGSRTGFIPGYGLKTSRNMVTFPIVEKQQPFEHCLGILPAAHCHCQKGHLHTEKQQFSGAADTCTRILPVPEGPAAGKFCSRSAALMIHGPLGPSTREQRHGAGFSSCSLLFLMEPRNHRGPFPSSPALTSAWGRQFPKLFPRVHPAPEISRREASASTPYVLMYHHIPGNTGLCLPKCPHHAPLW